MAVLFEWIFIGGWAFFSYAMFYFGFNSLHKYTMMRNIPKSTIRSMAIGMVDLQGKVVPVSSENVLKSPVFGTPCVYYRYQSEGSVGKASVMGPNGKIMETYIGYIEKGQPFYLEDETGHVLVDPFLVEPHLPMSYGAESLKHKHGARGEMTIPIGSTIRVMGTAVNQTENLTNSSDENNLIVRKMKYEEPFFISNENEKNALIRMKIVGIFFILFGIILAGISLFFLIITLRMP